MLGALAAPAHAADPLAIVRAFAQADGRGARLDARSWPTIAPLVNWALEPAWDRIYLIHGYEIGTPQQRDGLVEVEVQYHVVREVRGTGTRAASRVDTRRVVLEGDGAGHWVLRGPPPPPYVFESEADPEILAALLDPGDPRYLSNSAFVWQLLRDAGWEADYADTDGLPTAPDYRSERTANIGDLALYHDADGVPYHVGMIDSDETIVSATLNGGLRRTPFGAFAGEIRYLRPLAAAVPTPQATVTPAPRRKGTHRGGAETRKRLRASAPPR